MSTRSQGSIGSPLAAFGALVLAGSLWLPWYLIHFPQALRDAFTGLANGGAQSTGAAPGTAQNPDVLGALFKGIAAVIPDEITGNGWQVMNGGDVALAVIAGLALLMAVSIGGGFSGVRVEASVAGRLVAGMGLVAAAIVGYHMISRPGAGASGFTDLVSLKYGIVVGLVGALMIVAGGLVMAGRSSAAVVAPAPLQEFTPPTAPEAPSTWESAASVGPPGSEGPMAGQTAPSL